MRDIKACIWDMDHTLYEEWSGVVPGFTQALITVLRRRGVEPAHINDDEIITTVHEQVRLRGTSLHHFSEAFGIDFQILASEVGATLVPNHVKRCDKLPELFSSSHFAHAINTHANPNWSNALLVHLGLDQYFPVARRIHHIEHGAELKNISRRTHEAALNSLGVGSVHTVMIDDAVANLRIPKEMGMKTILICKETPLDLPDYVDATAQRAADVFTLLAA